MNVSDLRKRIIRALEDGRREAASRRVSQDEAEQAYTAFLDTTALPLLRQAQQILKAERQLFTVHAPAGSASLVSDASADTFLEFALDTSGARPQVLGRVSVARGRGRVVVDERPLAPETPVAQITEEHVAAFLVAEIPRLVGRS